MIAGIAKLESGYGVQACGSDYWGFNSCASHPWNTVQEGIEYVTKHIRVDYVNNWGYRDIWGIGNKWCTCGSAYGPALITEMNRLQSPLIYTYPRVVQAVG